MDALSPDLAFRAGNLLALRGWIALALSPPSRRWTPRRVAAHRLGAAAAAGASPTSRCSSGHWGPGGFGSLAEVRQLFERPGLLAAGWLHYLAFDLFVGTWIARDAGAARLAARGRAALPGADLPVRPGRPAGLLPRCAFMSQEACPMNPHVPDPRRTATAAHAGAIALRPRCAGEREPRLVAFALLMLALMLPAADRPRPRRAHAARRQRLGQADEVHGLGRRCWR